MAAVPHNKVPNLIKKTNKHSLVLQMLHKLKCYNRQLIQIEKFGNISIHITFLYSKSISTLTCVKVHLKAKISITRKCNKSLCLCVLSSYNRYNIFGKLNNFLIYSWWTKMLTVETIPAQNIRAFQETGCRHLN